jgi:PKD repeat protein
VAILFTGAVGGAPNVTAFSWDFDGDGTSDSAFENPTKNFNTLASAQTYDCTLTITETFRPDTTITSSITVTP